MSAVTTTSVAGLDPETPILRIANGTTTLVAPLVVSPPTPEPPLSIFDFICKQFVPWQITESPRMTEIIRRVADLENSRIYRHDSLSFPLQAAHNFTLFDYNPVEPEQKPLESRVVLLANTALQILRFAQDQVRANPQLAQHLHGIAATMILIACHSQHGPPSLDAYHDFMMQHVYHHVPPGELYTYQNYADKMIAELKKVARVQIMHSMNRQTEHNFLNPTHYKGLRMRDLQDTIMCQCQHMTNEQLGAMLDIARISSTDIGWAFSLAGKNELCGRGPCGIRGSARAAIESRYPYSR